jgi:hypothetical protein
LAPNAGGRLKLLPRGAFQRARFVHSFGGRQCVVHASVIMMGIGANVKDESFQALRETSNRECGRTKDEVIIYSLRRLAPCSTSIEVEDARRRWPQQFDWHSLQTSAQQEVST